LRGVCESCGAATNKGNTQCCRCRGMHVPPPGYIPPSKRGTCSRCGKIIQVGRRSVPEPVCHPCRRERNHAPPQPATCPVCTTEFLPTRRKGRVATQVYCSRNCASSRTWRYLPPEVRVKIRQQLPPMPRKRRPRPPGSTTAGGWGSQHQRIRAQWAPIVASGQAFCAQPVCLYRSRWIPPGTAWDLGHTQDRTGWIGPTHALCNRREGGIRGNKSPRRRRRRRLITSRYW
jgi:hypothetical protein